MLHRHKHQNKESGYIALLSTIIIGAVLLVMTVEAGRLGFSTRFMVLGSESKEQSRIQAIGCAEQAVAMVLADVQWHGEATTSDSYAGSCYVFPIQKNYPGTGQMTVRVQSVVRGSVTSIVKVYDMNEIRQVSTPVPLPIPSPTVVPDILPSAISWSEVPTLP